MDDQLITKICRMFKENNIHYQLMTNDQKQIVAVVMKYDKHEWSPLLAVVPADNNRVKIDFMQNEQKGKEKERTIPPHLLMRGCIRSCSFFVDLCTLMV